MCSLRSVLLLAALLLLTACGDRPSRADQDRADALAGQQAALQLVAKLRSIELPPIAVAIVEQLGTVLAGSSAYTEATADGKEIPAPTRAPDAIVADPAAYKTAGEKAKGDAAGRWLAWAALGSIALVAGKIALEVGRNIPGWGPLIGAAGDWVYRQTADKKRLETDRQADAALAGMSTVVAYGHAVTQQLEQVKPGASEPIKQALAPLQKVAGVKELIDAALRTFKAKEEERRFHQTVHEAREASKAADAIAQAAGPLPPGWEPTLPVTG